MATLDLVFEGGGAKGMVFVGALQELFGPGGHQPGRLLGTSAGAITAALVAAGYTPSEMLKTLNEKDAGGKSVFESFMGEPAPLTKEEVKTSVIRSFLRDVNFKFIPDFAEEKLDDQIAQWLADDDKYNNLYSFVDRGGWFSADAFVAWMERKLGEGTFNGKPRNFSKMTLAQFHQATKTEVSFIASDTMWARMLILNHTTAPDLPLAWAVRMSMSIPLVWQEVIWQKEWGDYLRRNVAEHAIVDGGMLSNFPISLFLAPDANVAKIMGEANSDGVLGLLIDDTQAIPFQERALIEYSGDPWQLKTVQRVQRLVSTMTLAHDAAAIELFSDHVVRLPAGGVGVIEFDMSDDKRKALVEAGRKAMQLYLAAHPDLGKPTRDIVEPPSALEIASRAAQEILETPES
ncbi:MAG: patatin-like phospholipase family protein [Caldilineaceae bacterium]|nr:patatin-like phospholipase family protein [Caldilineaceae bacterium]